MSKYTPGPWKAYRISKPDNPDTGCYVGIEGGKAITGWGQVTQTEANARLIAAAPQLLEACEAAEKYISMDNHFNSSYFNFEFTEEELENQREDAEVLLQAAIAAAQGGGA